MPGFNARIAVRWLLAELRAETEMLRRESYNSDMLYYIAMSQPWKNRRHLRPYRPLADEARMKTAKGRLFSAEDILRHFKNELEGVTI